MSVDPNGIESLQYDTVIVGAGPAGMTAAIVAHAQGLRPLIVEKTDQIGGTAAWAAGMLWFVDTKSMQAQGFVDSFEQAHRYFEETVGNAAPAALQERFIKYGSEALDYMVANSALRATAVYYPDYYSERDGAVYGRAHAPNDFDGRTLGKNFKRLRGPIAAFAPLGGMMLNMQDLLHLMSAMRSLKSLWHVTKILARHGVDRLSHHRGTRLTNGNALAGQLYKSVLDRQIPVWLNAKAGELILEAGTVVGVSVERDGARVPVRASRGVVLATGGYPANEAMRQAYSRQPNKRYSLTLPENNGDGIALAQAAGARLDANAVDTDFYMPVSELPNSDGTMTLWGHWAFDRPNPGFIAVREDGRRFTDEAASYHSFALGMLEHGTGPAFLIADATAVRKYGIGAVLPGGRGHAKFVKNHYLFKGATVAELAERIGVDPASLESTVERFNGFAATGVDEDFGKGSSGYDRFFADAAQKPNPCMAPLTTGPFYAVKMMPGDFGTSRGLVTGLNGEVLDAAEKPIPGLYACGNDMNSPVGGSYIGAGITLGPAITFGYLAALSLAGSAPT